MSSEKNGKNLEYMSMEESQEVMVKGNAYEKGRGRKPPSKGGVGWLRRRTTLEKFLLLLLLFLIVVCIILLISLIVTAASSVSSVEVGGTTSAPLTTEGVCTTPDCVMAAGTVLSNMDPTADPCQDFYQFACGGWNHNHYIPEELSKYNVFDDIFQSLMKLSRGMLEEKSSNDSESATKLKVFYTSCMDEAVIDEHGAEPLMDLLNFLGGWPVVAGDSWDEEGWDLIEALSKNRMELDYNFLFGHFVYPDVINSDKYIVVIDQPVLSLDERSVYLREKTDKTLTAYFDYMVNIATTLRSDKNRDEASRQMAEVLEFERDLANFSAPTSERRNPMSHNNRYTANELHTDMPQIDWIQYFRSIHTNFSPDEEMINRDPSYFENMADLISSTPKRTVANYLMWRVVFTMVEYLHTELRDIRHDFQVATRGVKREQSRWKTCYRNSNGKFGVAMGALFIKKHFDDESKASAHEMLEDIRETLKETLNDVPWMDEQTKTLAARKASKTTEKIGYDDILKDEEAINKVYSSIEMSPTNYFENVRAVWRNDAKESVSNYGKDVEEEIWQKSPIDINAYYTNQNNAIIFAAGVFQPPFYSRRFPKSMNYGGIGMVMGHELMHGFDDTGSQYDEYGNMNQWFSNSSLKAYEERKQCFIDQYSSYYVPEVELYLNGEHIQGEVLADNGGIKEAYLGYKRWLKRVGDPGDTLPGVNLNHDQLFFLNFAQMWCGLHRKENLEFVVRAEEHPPEKFRVLGTLSNSEYFAAAYRCKKGSPMVRDEPCKLW